MRLFHYCVGSIMSLLFWKPQFYDVYFRFWLLISTKFRTFSEFLSVFEMELFGLCRKMSIKSQLVRSHSGRVNCVMMQRCHTVLPLNCTYRSAAQNLEHTDSHFEQKGQFELFMCLQFAINTCSVKTQKCLYILKKTWGMERHWYLRN